MKAKKTINTIIEEVIANGIGWIAGLLSIDLLKIFFVKKSILNLWGLGQIFTKRTIIDKDTFSLLEWTLTAIIGFVVMLVINKFVRKKFFKKKKVESEPEEIQSEEHVISTVYDENTSIATNQEQMHTEDEDLTSTDETKTPPEI